MFKLTRETLQLIREYLNEFYASHDVVFFKSREDKNGWTTGWKVNDRVVLINYNEILNQIQHFVENTGYGWELKEYSLEIGRLENKIQKLLLNVI